MRKQLLSLILVSLAVFTFSCSTGVSNSENKSEKITSESLRSTGVEHNLLLDKAYSYLKTKKN